MHVFAKISSEIAKMNTVTYIAYSVFAVKPKRNLNQYSGRYVLETLTAHHR